MKNFKCKNMEQQHKILRKLNIRKRIWMQKTFVLFLFAEKPFLLTNKKAPKTGLLSKTSSKT